LTEDADAMTVHQDLVSKSGLLTEKLQMLTDLKDEMTALNEKLKGQQSDKLNQKQATIDGYSKTAQEQQDKVQMLVSRLDELDKKINQLDDALAQKDKKIAELKGTIEEQKDQIALLQDQSRMLSSKGTEAKTQVDQLDALSKDAKDLEAKDKLILNQAQQIHALTQKPDAENRKLPSEQNTNVDNIQSQVDALKDRLHQQDQDLKAKIDSIRWLNEVLAATKNKAEYFKLTAQQEHMSMQQLQQDVRNIKDDFAQRFKDFDHYASSISSLKDQVALLGGQLAQKQQQVDLLKDELEKKIADLHDQKQAQEKGEETYKAQLGDKQEEIVKMKKDIDGIHQGQANDDRLKLAQQLINLQEKEASLIDEKSRLALMQYDIFDRHFNAFEKKMRSLLADHQVQNMDQQARMEELKDKLNLRQQEIDTLKGQLEAKINDQKDQEELNRQNHELKAQLVVKEDQIADMKKEIQQGQGTKEDRDALKRQLALQQDRADQLKQQLDNETAQSGKMTLMLEDYQKKLESGDNANSQELKQVLASRNDQAQMEKQIASLNAQLQQKDLTLSMLNLRMKNVNAQEITDLKTELALAREQLKGMPSSDEIEFLRSGLKKAALQLKQKSEMFLQIKANADEYAKEFKAQTQEFQSVKQQLQNAYVEINHRNEDLKYKNLELTRLKERTAIKEGELQDKIRSLTRGISTVETTSMSKSQRDQVVSLEVQLKNAALKIKQLKSEIDGYKTPSKPDALQLKLTQALDKIDEQGRVIDLLTKKLQESGQTVDLTKELRQEQ
jgi:chromosome segregation ATPase